MAERVNVSKKTIEDLEKQITCAICHDQYTEPKILSCEHYYCKQCINRLALRTGLDKPFSCPECRKGTTLPQGNVDKLKTAFFVNRLIETHSKLVEEMTAMQESVTKMCKEHEEPLKIYCFTCDRLICRDCTVKDHPCPEHQYEFVKKAAPETKKMLIQQLEPLKEMKANLSLAVKEVQTTKSEIEAQGDSVANEIKKSHEELHMIIENRTRELLREAEMKVMQKLKNLSDQEEELSTACAVVTNVIEHTQQSVEQSTEEKILCTQAEHEKQIKKSIKEHYKKSLDPVEEVDIGVEMSCADDLKQLCKTKSKMIRLPIDPAKCIVSCDGMKTVEINEMAKLDFSLRTKQSTKHKCAIECHLKSLVNGSIIKCMVDQIGGNEYRIQYTPVIRGRHELAVTVNEQEVAGSPLPVFVSIHPSNLGKPVMTIETQSCPSCIAVTSVGEVIVAGSCIEVFDRKGVKLRTMNPSDYGLDCLFGMAVDSTNKTVYIIGDNNEKAIIVKLSEDMSLLKTMQSKVISGWFRFRGIAVVGDEVMVCSSKNNSCIHVYTTELQYVRKIKIGSHDDAPGRFIDISSDENGNLYVSHSNSIQVFSNGGKFLHSFKNGVNMVTGVSVAGQYVYVVNWGEVSLLNVAVGLVGLVGASLSLGTGVGSPWNISVFTTMGKYVTSFGHGRTKLFSRPWKVYIDQDGFAYVCDRDNERVQVF